MRPDAWYAARMVRLSFSIAVFVPVLVIASCSDASSPSGENAEADASSSSSNRDGASTSTANDSAVQTDVSADALGAAEASRTDAASPDAAAAADAGPPCTDLVDLSAGAVPVKKSGSAPVASSGSLAGGTYVLTKVEYWGGTLSGTWHGTYRFSGNGYEYADGSYREQGDVIFSTTNDNQWTQRVDCPASNSPWLFYFFSATGNEFVLHTEAPDGPRLRTFTRLVTDAGGGG